MLQLDYLMKLHCSQTYMRVSTEKQALDYLMKLHCSQTLNET